MLLFYLVLSAILSIQLASNTTPRHVTGQEDHVVSAKGTGQTTGHIATLTLRNTSQEVLELTLGPFFIPGTDKYQGYIVPDETITRLEPGVEQDVPIYGYCTDIHKPPVSDGEEMPRFNTWTTPEPIDQIDPNYFSPGDPGVKPRDTVHRDIVVTYPGTDKPIPVAVDIDANPGQSGPVIITAIRDIIDTYDRMHEAGDISTPFSGDPERERDAVIQNTFWIFTSALEDDEYVRDDFADNTIEEFETSSGRNYNDLQVADQEKLQIGVDQFWSTFTAVGVEAKVLSDPESDISYPTGSESSIPIGVAECHCTWARILGIDILQDGQQVDYPVLLPGNYQLQVRVGSDCTSPCELDIRVSWLVDFIPADGGAVLEYSGAGTTFDIELNEEGTIRPSVRVSVYCDRTPCPIDRPTMHTEYEIRRCRCTYCRVVEPLKVYLKETGEEITGDSVPWGLDLISHPPVVQSDCPADCRAYNHVAHRRVPRYAYYYQTPSVWTSNSLETIVWNPGEVIFESRYNCYCEGADCGHGTDTRTLVLFETNDCCDQIRRQNPGQSLKFDLGDGHFVQIYLNQLIIHLNPGIWKTIYFNFNLEAMFCNLDENEIYSLFESQSESSTSGGATTETYDISSLGLDHPTGEGSGSDPHYILSFSQEVDGKEYKVVISIDERTCNYDISVLYEDALHEHAGPPNYSPAELNAALTELLNSTNSGETSLTQFLNRMLHLLLQIMKGIDQGDNGYHDPLVLWRVNLLSKIDDMHAQTNDYVLKDLLDELRGLLMDVGSDPDDILQALMRVMSH